MTKVLSSLRQKTQPYVLDDAILTVDLTNNRKYYKFVKRTGQDPPDTGSPFGFITFSQPKATYFDNVIPRPESENVAITGFVIYFNERQDSNSDGIYESWSDFNLVANDCCQPDKTAAEAREFDPNGRGTWKWDSETEDWVFQADMSIQDLNGYYRIASPNSEEPIQSDPPVVDHIAQKYFIKIESQN
ncbi:MAG: hypothetical protein V1257_11350 [Candidatus Neomarinimicrobiota bacterium]|jgi:hypothetical protein|nr:hypothetical protein [Candidatus Neomarinimicrobiota bacterium]|tara:strand:+ start:292 stop:855 length:564 start_codon:yes stop_codon:yes gene_type:complete